MASHPFTESTMSRLERITSDRAIFGGKRIANDDARRTSDRRSGIPRVDRRNPRGCVFNLLDTPGHEGISEDTCRTLTAVDSAVMVIDAAKGIEERVVGSAQKGFATGQELP